MGPGFASGLGTIVVFEVFDDGMMDLVLDIYIYQFPRWIE